MHIDINFMSQEGFSIVKAQLITLTNVKKNPTFYLDAHQNTSEYYFGVTFWF